MINEKKEVKKQIILAIDSSGLVASTAVLVDGIVVGEYNIHNKKTHSQTLLPMIRDMLKMADIDVSEIDAIAVSAGPGSFTGLRIGASTAKGIGGVLNVPLLSISSLQGISYNFAGFDGLVCSIMDARRNQTYCGIYDVSNPNEIPKKIIDENALAIEEVVKKVNELGKKVVFAGDGVAVFSDYIKENIKVDFIFAPSHLCYQMASSIANLGKLYLEENMICKVEDFAPVYLRLSQAERERLKAENDK